MLNPLTTQKLERLGLGGMLRVLQQTKATDANKLSFDERFGILLDAEITDRDGRRIERLESANTRCVRQLGLNQRRQCQSCLAGPN